MSRRADDRRRGAVLAIDAGGSTTQLRAVHGDAVLVERTGEGLNRPGIGTGGLHAVLQGLAAGIDDPASVVAAVSGPGTVRTAAGDWLEARFPASRVLVVTDHDAAWATFDDRIDLCVVAGTGSVVVGRSPDGRVQRTGGLGFAIGEPGSAPRLGQRLVTVAIDEPHVVGPSWTGALETALGVDLPRVVATVHASDRPAALLGRAAPVLTAAAEHGETWAEAILHAEMEELAEVVGRHRRRYADTAFEVVGLAGGVWRSPAAVATFAAALEREHGVVQVVRPMVDGVEGCLRLARCA